MKVKRTGNLVMQQPHRAAGTYQIAFAVTTPSGKTGVAFYHYEYDKRDVINELMYTSQEIADELREYIGDDSPCAFGCFDFPPQEEENTNIDAVKKAKKEAGILIYGWDG